MKISIKLAICFSCLFFVGITNLFSQKIINVSGYVKATDGTPLSWASVKQKNGKIATISNQDGLFSIKVHNTDTLVFSYEGYTAKEILATERLDVSLVPKVGILEDVEVVVDKGYGKSKRLAVSSSISSVAGKDLQNQTAYNMGTLLQGKVPGVQVSNTGDGFPKILIRGFTTLNTSTDPLIILDGINLGRANLNLINVNDVETIDILKDGAAASIYGSDASGGVIVITTKKGKIGKLQTDASINYGREFYNNPHLASASEYLQIQQRRFTNYSTPTWAANTNWWNAAISNTNVVNANVSMSGATDKINTYGSVSYYRTEGPFYDGYTQKATARFNLEYKPNKFIKVGTTIFPRFESWQNSGFGSDLMSVMRTEPILPIYYSRPGQNEYSQFSSSFIERNVNPVAYLARNKNNWNYFLGLIGDVHVEISPIKNLTVRSQTGINTGNTFSRSYSPPFNNDFFGARDRNYDSIPGNSNQTSDNYLYASRAYSSSNYNIDWKWTNTANYSYNIGTNHKFNLMVGYESRKETGANNSLGRAYIPVDQPGLWNPSNAGTPILSTSPNNFISGDGSRYNETWLSFFSRFNYEYNNKYFVELSVRRDGSSRFPANNKYGNFPSVSGSWIVTKEKFIQKFKQLSFLKLRAGYGTVGNASFNDPSVGLNLLNPSIIPYSIGANSYYVIGGTVGNVLGLGRPGNPNLIWETTQDKNIAFESYWLKNKLYVNFELFNRQSKNLIYYDNLGRPDLGIRTGSWYNLGNMEVRGMESVVGYRDKLKNGLKYDVSINFSRNRVYLNQLGTNNAPLLLTAQGPYRVGDDLGGNTVKVDQGGGLLGNYYGYRVLGVFQNWYEINAYTDKSGNLIQPNAKPGDFKFADINRDGSINESDKTTIGNAYPKFELGLNIKVEYKGFDLAVTGYGRFGQDVFWVAKKWLVMGALGSNVLQGSSGKAWSGEGSTNAFPRFINDAQDANSNLKSSNSWFIEKGDYFRLDNIQLGYTLNQKLGDKIHVKRLRVYVNMQNIVTITKYPGLNPEIFNNDFGLLAPGFDLSQAPIRKAITMGLTVGL